MDFGQVRTDYASRSILISFEPEWFQLVESGQKKFEYRKHFPTGRVDAYFYVSSPVKAITGFARFGEKESLLDWQIKFSNRSPEVLARISDFLIDCNWAVPILEFQRTNLIPLNQLRKDIPGFVVPRMYYFIDDSPLQTYLHDKLIPQGQTICHSFDLILDSDIC